MLSVSSNNVERFLLESGHQVLDVEYEKVFKKIKDFFLRKYNYFVFSLTKKCLV